MTENMKKLLEIASGNEELKDKLSKASKEEIIAIAKENGITIAEADFEEAKGELNDDELAAISGGETCDCWIGGGGKGSAGQKTCGCGGLGFGYTSRGKERCSCVAIGIGNDFT